MAAQSSLLTALGRRCRCWPRNRQQPDHAQAGHRRGRAGSLGFLASGYKTPDALAEDIAAVRRAGVSFGVNLFAPNPVPVDPEAFRGYARAIDREAQDYGIDLREAAIVEDDDRWRDKIDLLLTDPVPIVRLHVRPA